MARVTPAGIDPFGQVRSGSLNLSGRLRKIVYRKGNTNRLGTGFAFPLFVEGGTAVKINDNTSYNSLEKKRVIYARCIVNP